MVLFEHQNDRIVLCFGVAFSMLVNSTIMKNLYPLNL